MDYIAEAKRIIELEVKALQQMVQRLGPEFERAVELIRPCGGRVVVTGVGKAGIIGQKISATLASTGTPSHWMHAVEARHGDLGRVHADDVVLALSNSGESEVVQLLPALEKIGTPVIAITGHPGSSLGRHADVVLDIGKTEEACPLGLAPSSSSTAMLVMGDALALTLFGLQNWEPEDYAFFHPGGDLGRQLTKVSEVMRKGAANPVASADSSVSEVLQVMGGSGSPGAVSLVDKGGELVGFFTDGDLRRLLSDGHNRLIERPVSEVMSCDPKTVSPETSIAEARRLLRRYRIDQVPVVDAEGRPVGLLDVQDWLETAEGTDRTSPAEGQHEPEQRGSGG